MVRIQVKFYLILLMALSVGVKGQEGSLEALKEALNSKEFPNIDGVLLAQKDEVLLEEYLNGYTQKKIHDTRSAFKSITSLLAGIAVDQGLFEVEDSIGKYIGEWSGDSRGTIRVKDLLAMKSGLDCKGFFGIGPDCESEMWETKSWEAFILDIPSIHEPGMNWAYSSIEPELIGLIISRASGLSLMDFARQYLFDPLGIDQYEWFISPEGRGYAAGSFFMRPRDMLKIAQLVLDGGKWKGNQLVSESWIKESTHCVIDVEMSFMRFSRLENAKYSAARYGYFWYRENLSYGSIDTEVLFASGNGGQYMMILKDYDAVVVFTGSNFGSWRGKLPFEV